MKSQRWLHGLILAAGAWLFFSPFLITSYAAAGGAAILNSHIAGVVLCSLAAIALFKPWQWLDWSSLGVGCWLIVAPLALGFSSIAGIPTTNHMMVGIVVGLAALGLIALHRGELRASHADPSR